MDSLVKSAIQGLLKKDIHHAVGPYRKSMPMGLGPPYEPPLNPEP